MRIAYLDCFAGISGDMFLGALLDAGVPEQVLQDATAALNIGARLRIETVDRSGISCTKVHVLEHDYLAEAETHRRLHEEISDHTNASDEEAVEYRQHPKTQHLHKGGHAHEHDVKNDGVSQASSLPHVHGRSLTEIRRLIQEASLQPAVKDTAIRVFEALGASEAKIHNVAVDEIHFHEVGAVDAIVDIVAASAGIHHLQIGAWHSSPLNVGSGTVVCAHGTFPVPAPATADLLRGYPTYSAHVQREMVTPTGAALLRVLAPNFGQQPMMRVESIGYGAGTRNPENFPNVLRLSIGETFEGVPMGGSRVRERAGVQTDRPGGMDVVTVLETALDDLSPQLLAFVAEKALADGALDVMLTPVIMKKGRPGTLLTVLCEESTRESLQQLIFRETSTLGMRVRKERRIILQRHHVSVQTSFGIIRVKVGIDGNDVRSATPEFEDCRKAATEFSVPVKIVQGAASAAYLATL